MKTKQKVHKHEYVESQKFIEPNRFICSMFYKNSCNCKLN